MIKKPTKCLAHSEGKARLFCKEEKCLKYICQFCVEESHINHNVVDLNTLLEEVGEYEKRRMSNKPEYLNSLKELLTGLDKMRNRIEVQQKNLLSEEEKLKYQFEKRIQKLGAEERNKREVMLKTIKELVGKIESSLYDTQNEADHITKLFENLRKDIGEESVKKLFLCGGEKGKTIAEVISAEDDAEKARNDLTVKLTEGIRELDEQISSYEALTLNQLFPSFPFLPLSTASTPMDTISPKKISFPVTSAFVPSSLNSSASPTNLQKGKFEKLQIKIPITPKGMYSQPSPSVYSEVSTISRQRDVLDKVNVKIIQAEGTLKNLMRTIGSKQKELEGLEKVKSEILKLNNILRMNMEKQNKAYVQAIESMAPDKVKDKIITPESLFARSEPAGMNKKKIKSSKIPLLPKESKATEITPIAEHQEEQRNLLSDYKEDILNCKSCISDLKVGLDNLNDFIRLTRENFDGAVDTFNAFAIDNRKSPIPTSEIGTQTSLTTHEISVQTGTVNSLNKDCFNKYASISMRDFSKINLERIHGLERRLSSIINEKIKPATIAITKNRLSTKDYTNLLELKVNTSAAYYKKLIENWKGKFREPFSQIKRILSEVLEKVGKAFLLTQPVIDQVKKIIIQREEILRNEFMEMNSALMEARKSFENTEEYQAVQAELSQKDDQLLVLTEQSKEMEAHIEELEKVIREYEQKEQERGKYIVNE